MMTATYTYDGNGAVYLPASIYQKDLDKYRTDSRRVLALPGLRKWHRTYTFRTFSWLARATFFTTRTVGHYTKLVIGFTGILALLPLAQRKKEISVMLAFGLAISGATFIA